MIVYCICQISRQCRQRTETAGVFGGESEAGLTGKNVKGTVVCDVRRLERFARGRGI